MGTCRGAASHSVNSGPPHISETARARTLRFYAHLHKGQVHFLGVIFFRQGACKGHRTPYCVFGTPHISAISRDRKLKCNKRLGMVKYFFSRVTLFLRQGACKGRSTPTVHLGPPLISETIRARKLKFYKHLGRVKYSFRVWIFLRYGAYKGCSTLLYQMYSMGCLH